MNITKRTLRADTIRKAMGNAARLRIANGCVRIFDLIQTWPKHEQIMAAAAAFMLICNAAGVDPRDAFQMTENLTQEALRSENPLDLSRQQFTAMKFHLDTEINA